MTKLKTLVLLLLCVSAGVQAKDTKTLEISGTDLNHISGNNFVYTVSGVGTFTISGAGALTYGVTGWPTWPVDNSSPSLKCSSTGSYTISCTPESDKKIKVQSVDLVGASQGAGSTVNIGAASKWWLNDGYSVTYTANSGTLDTWDNISFSVVTKGVNLKKITINYELYSGAILNDTEDNSSKSGVYDYVELNRSLKTTWNTLCLPFSLTDAQVTTMFGSDAQVAKFTGVTGQRLLFTTATDRAISANEPCLIKVGTAGSTYELPIADNVTVTLSPAEAKATEAPFTLVGSYAPMMLPVGSYFISGDKFYEADQANTVSLKGFRAYVTEDGNGAKAFEMSVDGQTTAVTGIQADGQTAKGNIYDLSGRLVKHNATSTEDLPQGIYLMNGRKVVVK
jgi:hypothetical protein